ncbi:MAG: hypothetical protein A2527_11445 [Candidatus Lambdaproteobacteria bacterium RIFOXYD2_FULL_50_16]|uniref:Uncharacterized protein n=1 Tax=Candidatus Lambdaproteobacteria bacterium RIFOXYD2_FULL_50_16 TaxID=1817772 RepID=A0A1F6G6J3_9PROT|nr:MAG: hypothetical protein A2527_11445 [Candidatus Lambdaproteobacteria bacterium RIFOXYD2_FULL_50_16]
MERYQQETHAGNLLSPFSTLDGREEMIQRRIPLGLEAGTISGLFCARQFTGWDIPIYNVNPAKGGWTGT